MKRIGMLLVVVLALFVNAGLAQTIYAAPAVLNTTFTVQESLALSVANSTLDLTKTPGSAGNNATITLSYNLNPSRPNTQNVSLQVYLTDATAALTGAGLPNIPGTSLVPALSGGPDPTQTINFSDCGTTGPDGWVATAGGPTSANSMDCSRGYVRYSVWHLTPGLQNTTWAFNLGFKAGTTPTTAGSWSGTVNVIAEIGL